MLACQAVSARALQVRGPTYASNGGETSPSTAILSTFSRVLGASDAPETWLQHHSAAGECFGCACEVEVAWKKDNSISSISI